MPRARLSRPTVRWALFAFAATAACLAYAKDDDPTTAPPTTATSTKPVAAAAPNPAPNPALALVGQTAPDFTLPDQNDKPHTLSGSRGKWIVVAFYPADMTTGCTFQNISYTRTSDKFAPLDALVYTISTQDTASKKQFCAKDSLTHTLLADVGGKTAEKYHVLNGKVARRITFYIAPDGTIVDVDTKIRTRTAGEDSLKRLNELELQPRISAMPTTTESSPGTPILTAPQ